MQHLEQKNSLLIGSFGAENLGDEMILLSALEAYTNVIVMTANADKSSAFVEQKIKSVRPFPVGFRSWWQFVTDRVYWSEIFSLNTKIDQIVFPGGGLFKNNTKAIVLWFFMVLWCRILLSKVPIIFRGQGIDWPRQFWLQRLVRWVFMQAKVIGVRDEISAKNLIKLSVYKKILLQGDAVENYMVLEQNDQPEELSALKIKDKNVGAQNFEPDGEIIDSLETKYLSSHEKNKKILINAAKPFDYEELIKKIEQKYNSNYELSFVVFDPADLEQVPSDFNGTILQPQTFSDLKQIFSLRPICIGQRFHFLIFGQKFGSNVFLLEQAYAPKTHLLAEKHQMIIFGKE